MKRTLSILIIILYIPIIASCQTKVQNGSSKLITKIINSPSIPKVLVYSNSNPIDETKTYLIKEDHTGRLFVNKSFETWKAPDKFGISLCLLPNNSILHYGNEYSIKEIDSLIKDYFINVHQRSYLVEKDSLIQKARAKVNRFRPYLRLNYTPHKTTQINWESIKELIHLYKNKIINERNRLALKYFNCKTEQLNKKQLKSIEYVQPIIILLSFSKHCDEIPDPSEISDTTENILRKEISD